DIADCVAHAILPQPEKKILNEDQEKKRAAIALEMAYVKLSGEEKKFDKYDFDITVKQDKHNLGMQSRRAELAHQKASRNAQLISMLLKEDQLGLEEAMALDQCATGMI
ncbi:hypothetical protein DFH28DRAFT_901508, partial [Melampsora americana]